ncbi:MAG: ElyC/SanA/YdcF family protein [Patescibacteria group bacterium]|jgi:vancomycin permeability regulator SanA
MLKNFLSQVKQFLIWAICVVVFLLGWMILHVQTNYLVDMYPSTDSVVDKAQVAIVLGAAVTNGQPSDALNDRLLVGEELYRKGKVEKILITGDDGGFHSDEISIMHKFLLDREIPPDAIIVDGKGYRTYESCRRAKQEYNIETAVVVTQRFHMGRALYLCNALGIESVGVTSDLQTYVRIKAFWIRDLLSSVKAFWEINRDRAGQQAI